jgi:hypothetical protein
MLICPFKQLEIMELDNLRIGFCEHTNRPVVQEKFGEEWVCIHSETEEQELEDIKELTQLLTN